MEEAGDNVLEAHQFFLFYNLDNSGPCRLFCSSAAVGFP